MLSVALLSPKGRLYRNRTGIFKRSLRYAPLTLPTLASLIPSDIPHRVTLIDEGIRDIPLDLQADIIGITVITPTAPRSYWLADHFRARGATVVLGGPHVTLVPDEAMLHADATCCLHYGKMAVSCGRKDIAKTTDGLRIRRRR